MFTVNSENILTIFENISVSGQDELRFKHGSMGSATSCGPQNVYWWRAVTAPAAGAAAASWGINFKALAQTLAVANNSS